MRWPLSVSSLRKLRRARLVRVSNIMAFVSILAANAMLPTTATPQTAVAMAQGNEIVCGCSGGQRTVGGSFSCVVVESGGVCKIDTDPFKPSSEAAGARFISRVWERKIEYVHISNDEPNSWALIEDRNLVKQLSVYFGNLLNSSANGTPSESEIKRFMDTLFKYSSEIASTFTSEVVPSSENAGVFATYGCIEFLGPEFSVLFKARWTSVADSKRCR